MRTNRHALALLALCTACSGAAPSELSSAPDPIADAGSPAPDAREASPGAQAPDAGQPALACAFLRAEDGHGACNDQGLPSYEYRCTGPVNYGNQDPAWPAGPCYWTPGSGNLGIACCATCDRACQCALGNCGPADASAE